MLAGDAAVPGRHVPGNMFVPVEILKPVFGELLEQGRRAGNARPWIGANTVEMADRLVVARVSPGGPAAKAGIESGELILGVAGKPVSGLADFYRKFWSHGPEGISVPLNLLPKDYERDENPPGSGAIHRPLRLATPAPLLLVKDTQRYAVSCSSWRASISARL